MTMRAKVVLSKSNFDVKDQQNFFILRLSIQETIFLQKHYFPASIFEQLYFLKLDPVFDELTFVKKKKKNPLSISILGKNLAIWTHHP